MPDFSIRIRWRPVEIPNVQIPCCHVEGWEDMYAVACDGQIWSTYNPGLHRRTTDWRKIRGVPTQSGHRWALLKREGHSEHVYVHWLVLEAFDEAWPGGRIECRHLDGDPGNNWWWNLRWGTRQENVDDKEDHGRLLTCETHPHAVLTAAMVAEARRRYSAGDGFDAIAKLLNVDRGTIHSAITGKSWFNLTDPPPVASRSSPMTPDALRRIASMIRANAPTADIVASCNVRPTAVSDIRRRIKNDPTKYR